MTAAKYNYIEFQIKWENLSLLIKEKVFPLYFSEKNI